MFDEFSVALDAGVEMAELPEQLTPGLRLGEDPSLDGFVFSGFGHESVFCKELECVGCLLKLA